MKGLIKSVRPFRPTRPLGLVALLLLAMRLGAWWLRGAWARPEAQATGFAMGLGYDLALLLSLWLMARALRAAGWARLSAAMLTASISAVTVIRLLDMGHCYLVQCHWVAEAFLYLEPSYVLGFGAPILSVSTLLLGAAIYGIWRLVRWDAQDHLPKVSRTWPLQAALVAAGLATLPLYDGLHAPEGVFNARLVPELNFLVKLRAWRADDSTSVPPLSDEQQRRWRRAGLLPAQPSPLRGFPLVQKGLDEPALPVKGQVSEERPNLVLAVVESLDALFIHELSGHFKGVMPNLSKAARKHTSVTSFYNTATPTISAMTALLCSVYAPTHPKDMSPGRRGQVLTAHTCLSDLLKQAGYRSVFIMGAPSSMTRTGDFLRHHGIDEVLDKADFDKRFPDRKQGVWGAHDDAMIDVVIAEITRLEALKKRDGRPYFLMFMNLDTHEPGMAEDSCVLPDKDRSGDPVTDIPDNPASRHLLASYHCADRELGRLLRFLAQPERASQTLWALTGDHVAFRTAVSRPLLEGRRWQWSFARMPLIIHDPMHDLPSEVATLSGSLDLAPTLLHLLGVNVGMHSMTGKSIFGTRRQTPWLLGRVGGRLVYANNQHSEHEATRSTLQTICEQGSKLVPKGEDWVTACDVLDWLRWQDALWSNRRLYPTGIYHGQLGR